MRGEHSKVASLPVSLSNSRTKLLYEPVTTCLCGVVGVAWLVWCGWCGVVGVAWCGWCGVVSVAWCS